MPAKERVRILGDVLRDRAGRLARGEDGEGKPLFLRIFDRSVHDIQGFSHRLVLRLQHLRGASHPAIPAVRSVQLQAQTPTIVLEGAPGTSLAERTKTQGPIRPARAGAILSQALGAIEVLSEAKVLPAVLSANTIWITTEGKTLLLALETPPELLARDGPPPDLPALLLALGAAVYEAVSGRPPYQDLKALPFTLAPPPPLASIAAAVPPELSNVLAKLLSPRPEDRVADLAAASECLGGLPPISGTTSTRLSAAALRERPRWRRRAALAAGAGLLLALALLLLVPWTGGEKSILTQFVGGSEDESGPAPEGRSVSELSSRLAEIRKGGPEAFEEEEAFLRDVTDR
ncbi:MAG: hypothetical protein HY720_21470, partial [Planctomycetes bacterium]|nr:hypothetical protein [Planctomycetota bacterium]